ncbi:unnamed protein product [Caenorhabditis bovis]|uniref:Alpha-(1,6)-fucosyltransferase n=1 Tax=Caenorhabditis bovis TaxID=2654633 RepID=A0A8S1E5G6_9PELO|nr:unnamed protein product [Caenorhabditis bovis]
MRIGLLSVKGEKILDSVRQLIRALNYQQTANDCNASKWGPGVMLKCIAAIGSILWISTIIFVYTQLSTNSNVPARSSESIRNWRETLEILETLKSQNDELKRIIEAEREQREKEHSTILLAQQNGNAKIGDDSPKRVLAPPMNAESQANELKFNVEVERRLLDDRIREMFYRVHSSGIQKDAKSRFEEQLISLMGLSGRLEVADGSEEVRRIKRKKITERIMSGIQKLQKPEACNKAKILVCNLNKECGFGCQLHHVTYCAISALATMRTLVLQNNGKSWKYSRNGWESVFLPISPCKYDDAVASDLPVQFSEHSQARVVSLGIVDSLVRRPDFLPQAVPSSIINDLIMLHSNPPAFFIGTVISYLMRMNPETQKKLDEAASKIPIEKGPIVGLQVRRTDKVGTEAAFHKLSEYMEWTEYWFKVEERKLGRNVTRRVFIASDDPSVVPEAKKSYPQYEVYGSTEIAQTAQVNNRYSDDSLIGVITDIYILSKLDYLVCTFSSQVCRMGYELRQPTGADDGSKFHSLDDIYYFGGQQAHEVVAIEDHAAHSQIEFDFKTGDKIGIAGNHWDGFSKGSHRKTSKTGLFPSYKVMNDWRTYNFTVIV